jgi:hypothetical protein
MRLRDWGLLLLLWAISAGIFIYQKQHAGTLPLLGDTDDAMRMVVVRDMLAGQPWYDLFQHRLNTPFGAEIHWSKLSSVPIAGLILLLRPFAGGMTETLAAYAYPLLLLGLLLFALAMLTLRLAGRGGLLPALALPALSPALVAEFSPGRIDHHSLQIILTLLLAWCTVAALERPRFAIGAGIIAATSIAIGTEGLPGVASAILAFALLWVARPERADALKLFGISFAAATLLHLAAFQPPDRWLEASCDILSSVYAGAALLTGIAFVILSVLPLSTRPWWVRLIVGVVLGGLVLLALIVLFPQCLGGPYAAMDPWLVRNWLSRISEAKPAINSLYGLPAYTVGAVGPALLAVLVLLFKIWRDKERRGAWLLFGAFFLIAVLVMLVQIRGARIADALAIPAAAGLVVSTRALYLKSRHKVVPAIGLLASWIVFAGVPISMATVYVIDTFKIPFEGSSGTSRGDKNACLREPSFAELTGMAPQRLMTPIDLGAHMLLYTAHSVVSAPYHRNQIGVRDTFDFLNKPIEQAYPILERRGIDLVVVCAPMPEMYGFRDSPDDSFVRLFDADRLPAWLERISPDGATLSVYRVLPRTWFSDRTNRALLSPVASGGWLPVNALN